MSAQIGNRVEITAGGPHENIGLTGTIKSANPGDTKWGWIIKLDDRDGVWFYRESEFEVIATDSEPSDDEIYNGFGREGGIAYDPYDEPGSLGENDWRL